MRPGGQFTNNFFIKIQIQQKLGFIVIPFLVMISLQNFAHATTAQLSWHVYKFVAIALLEFGWAQNEIFKEFKLCWEDH